MPTQAAFDQPVNRSRLHEEIVTIIQKQIMSGAIAPGAKLPTERELAESFKVNRTTLREALRKLENLDLLDIRHGDGVYVKDYLASGNLDLIKVAMSLDERNETLLNALEGRNIVVPAMAALAAQRRNAADLTDLEHVVFEAELNIQDRDLKVHQLIARASHNLLMTILLNFFNQLFQGYGYLYFDNKDNVARSRKFHREILEAIKKQQPEEARRVMRDVMLYAEEAVKRSLARKQ
jgi:GntR family transcriptional repressor for pyruvate dehydrogenase complex